jgi:hypothetical protein
MPQDAPNAFVTLLQLNRDCIRSSQFCVNGEKRYKHLRPTESPTPYLHQVVPTYRETHWKFATYITYRQVLTQDFMVRSAFP